MAAACNQVGELMCSKCDEFDAKIKHIEDLARLIFDPQTQKSISDLITDLKVVREALHPQ